MKNDTLISVIVPIYNAEKYLKKCIESIINQDYKNIEIILINDGSVDSSEKICENYAKKDKRIKVIKKKNEGVSKARNIGIEISNGKWITFVDADDWIEKNYISYLYNNGIRTNSEISLTTFPNKYIENSYDNFTSKKEDVQILKGNDAAKMMLYYKIVISSWNKMYKKEMLEQEKIKFKENLSYGEGFEFVINAMIHSKKVCISNKKIYNYRVDNINSAMTVFKEKLVTGSLESQKYILKEINERYKNNLIVLNNLIKAWNYSYWHTNCDCLNTIYGSRSQSKYKKMTKKISENCRKGIKNISNKEVPNIDKAKIMLYFISPDIASKIINKLRKRKFNKNV